MRDNLQGHVVSDRLVETQKLHVFRYQGGREVGGEFHVRVVLRSRGRGNFKANGRNASFRGECE